MIIDGHAHICEASYGNEELLLKRMDEARIDKAVLVPGGMADSRRFTKYITLEEKPNSENIPNDLVEGMLRKYPEKFYGFYCINPLKGEQVLEEFEVAIKKGFSGLKLAPTIHNFSLSSKVVKELASLCGELNVPFYSHVVFSPAANTKKIGTLIKEFPKTNFIIGHMGFGPADVDAVDLAYEHDNAFLETSQSSFIILDEALNKCGSKKLIFGSEFPLDNQKAILENIIQLKCNSQGFEDIVCNNILKLINQR